MVIIFFIAAFFSELIGAVAGFGSSTIFLPLALLFVDFKIALVLVALMHVFGNIGRISFFSHKLNKQILLSFGIPSIVLSLIGAFLVNYFPQIILKGILGLFLVIYAIFSLWKEDLKLKRSFFNSILGGTLSGFLAGLIGTGGPLRSAFLTAFGLHKEEYIATGAVIALVVDITRIPVYFVQGFLNEKYFWYIPVLFITALFGSFVGKIIVKKIPQNKFKKIVLIGILMIGLKFIYDWMR